MNESIAAARTTDPATSHSAAASVAHVTDSQKAILSVLTRHGPLCDSNIIRAYRQDQESFGYPNISDPGIRSRRAELVDRGMIVDSGNLADLPTGRKSIIWRLA